MSTRLTIATGVLLMLLTTVSCAPPLLLAGVAAVGAGAVVSDKRGASVIVEDREIESAAIDAINGDPRLSDGVQVSVSSYNRIMLLTGQAPDGDAIDRIVRHARAVEGVRAIHNHVEARAPAPFRQRSADSMTTARVKSALIGEEGLSSMQVKVVSEYGSVYLMGLIRRQDAERVAQVVQQVDGVRRVVLVFEYTN